MNDMTPLKNIFNFGIKTSAVNTSQLKIRGMQQHANPIQRWSIFKTKGGSASAGIRGLLRPDRSETIP